METRSITISAKAVLKVLFILFAIWFLYQIRDIVALLFIAIIIASALTPVVDYFEKFSAPRWLVILAVYIIGASFLGLILWGVFPIVAVQIKEFGQNLPTVFNQSVETLGLTELFSDLDTRSIIPDVLGTFADQLIQTPANIYKFGASVFGGILSAFSLFIFSFYILMEKEKIKNYFLLLIPRQSRKHISGLVDKGEAKLGSWLRGQLTLMFIVGLLSLVGLEILDIKFSMTLAITAGILEIVPVIGPIAATIPAAMVALTQSVWHMVAVVAMYVFVQQLEQYVIIPRVMKSAVGLDPLTVILSVMIGSRLAGTVGALLAIPATVIMLIVWDEYKSRAYETSKE